MNLQVRTGWLKKVSPALYEKQARFSADDRLVGISAVKLSEESLTKLYDLAKANPKENGSRALMQRITNYRNVRANPEGKPVGKLEGLETALRAYIEPSPNKWLFFTESDGFSLPFFVRNIEYRKADFKGGRDRPAQVDVDLSAVTRGKADSKTIRYNAGDLGEGKTVIQLLNDRGYYLETPDAVKAYGEEIELYRTTVEVTGYQFECTGMAFPISDYAYHEIAMEREGEPARVVMDDALNGEDERSTERDVSTVSGAFWGSPVKNESEDSDDDDDENDSAVVVPVHPYARVFDLNKHEYVLVHTRNLTRYKYDKTAIDKLVLDQTTKDLVLLLVAGASEVMEDILKGKTGGTIVISTGPPGTGKTLTAEVASENLERPLYTVQCSQLGTDEESVEKKLALVLARASRWGAVLLIDEADVYVRARGDDIQQNAIVGVFLRVLERYRGILFLTSNRDTIIDDAILSRATAWVRYKMPTKEQLHALWKVLSKQYKMPLSEHAVEELVTGFPNLSGRNIKNMLKLGRMLLKARKTEKPDLDLFKFVVQFLDTPETREEKAAP